MKIQQMEALTGISKKNIRFYEKEGLLKPARGSNQYRTYTQDDVDALLQVKLLRRLGLSIEEIRLVQGGKTTLHSAMGWHIGQLDEKMRALQSTRALCGRIRDEGRELDALHTPAILAEIEELENRGEGLYGAAKELAGRVRRVLPPWPVYRIEPRDVIASPADVDTTLIDFAATEGLDLTILRGNSYVPVVMLDGQRLWGFVRTHRFGYRVLYLYRTQEDSQYFFISKINIKRIQNLFKTNKD